MNKNQYEKMGIDPHKKAVKETFKNLNASIFPNAFCVIKNDPHFPAEGVVMHADGSGSKSMLRLLHYLETNQESIFEEDIDDAISMNTSDIGACGFIRDIEFLNDIKINPFDAPKEIILAQFAKGIKRVIDLYENNLIPMGGETADLIRQINGYTLDVSVRASMPKNLIISGNVQPGDTIFGFASNGQAAWENRPNSGIMSNGLTMAIKTLLHKTYCKNYPEIFNIRSKTAQTLCSGKFKLTNYLPEIKMTVSEALLSPTRHWIILIRKLILGLSKRDALPLLHGIVINTGGGLTKCLNIGNNILYHKSIPVPPYLFQLIQQESQEDWKNMFTTFNCGIGIEVIGNNTDDILAKTLQQVEAETRVPMYRLGTCQRSVFRNHVVLESAYGRFEY